MKSLLSRTDPRRTPLSKSKNRALGTALTSIALVLLTSFTSHAQTAGVFDNLRYTQFGIGGGQSIIFIDGQQVLPSRAYGVEIPALINSQTVVAISEEAFANDLLLRTVVLPSNYPGFAIGRRAFAGCAGLSNVLGPNYGSLGFNQAFISIKAFRGCSSLDSFNLSGVIAIGEGAFRDCVSLRTVTLPSTIDRIPSSVTSIENGAFAVH